MKFIKKSILNNNIVQLFMTFFRIGAFTFGGGYAMIPLIQKEVVDQKKWLSDDDILDIIAIAESTPGPIAINSATFVGYKICGFWGAFFSTLGVILPSFVIISVISTFLNEYKNLSVVKYAFNGIRIGVLALLSKALWSMFKKCPKGIISYIIMLLSFIAVALFKIDTVIVIIICGIFGLITSLIAKRKVQ